jgi:acyl-coenzyme A synthetase/AMP-(fatty) acid ligase
VSTPGARDRAADNALIDARTGESTTWRSLAAPVLDGPTAALVSSSFEAMPYVRAHADSGEELLIVAESRMEPALRADLLGAGFSLVSATGSSAPESRRPGEPGRLWLLTSGSTGRPKRIGHTLASLTTVTRDQAPRRWLCPYSPGTYAWWQVVTLGLTPGQDLVVVDPADLEHWADAAVEHEVTAASGTPTFWRQSLMRSADQLARVPLQQISLGGEPVDQAILDQLRATFPHARISWIYASSEVGASIVVHDGRAGFPVEWLDRSVSGRPTISVQDDELVITSPYHGEGLSGAVRTGDRVQVADGRVHITGRVDTDEINVGGAKVSAGMVRDVLLSHPAVAWAKVSGRKAPLVGRMVVSDLVLADGYDSASVEPELVRWCQDRLPEYGVPRRFRYLDSIPTKETLKSDV